MTLKHEVGYTVLIYKVIKEVDMPRKNYNPNDDTTVTTVSIDYEVLEDQKLDFSYPAGLFYNTIFNARKFVATDNSRPALALLAFVNVDGVLRIRSSDGFRLYDEKIVNIGNSEFVGFGISAMRKKDTDPLLKWLKGQKNALITVNITPLIKTWITEVTYFKSRYVGYGHYEHDLVTEPRKEVSLVYKVSLSSSASEDVHTLAHAIGVGYKRSEKYDITKLPTFDVLYEGLKGDQIKTDLSILKVQVDDLLNTTTSRFDAYMGKEKEAYNYRGGILRDDYESDIEFYKAINANVQSKMRKDTKEVVNHYANAILLNGVAFNGQYLKDLLDVTPDYVVLELDSNSSSSKLFMHSKDQTMILMGLTLKTDILYPEQFITV